MADYYKLLGIANSASQDEIKKAFRKQAIKYHPDKNQGDKESEDKFKEVGKAYEILSDPEKRKIYDQYGESAFNGGGHSGSGFEDIFRGFGSGGSGSFEDIFENFFGGGSERRSSSYSLRGSDLQTEITFDLKDVLYKQTVELKLHRKELCGACAGTGSKSKASPSVCSKCRGSGKIQVSQGFFAMTQSCPLCHGMGKVVTDPCKTCHGESLVGKTEKVSVVVPAGVDDHMKLKIPNQGSAGAFNSQRGDLYLYINIRNNTQFLREGDTLFTKFNLSVTRAILGGEIEVETLSRKKRIKLPEGVQPGQRIKLDGEGMPNIHNGQRGHLYIEATIQIPKKINNKARKCLEQYAKALDESL